MELIHEIDEAVAQALAECSRSAAWRTYVGKHQNDLADSLQQIADCPHVGLASSGTAALEMLLKGCRLQTGDEVLLSGYDYPGTFAAIERAGARPALVDVAEQSWNLSWESLEATVTPACRVLIVSHLHGELQPIAELQRWCAARKIWLIQDACQALGASIEGQLLGRFGDATIFSFGGGKTISAGRGGAWAARDAELAQRARVAAGAGSGAHAMSELQAAVVLAQLPFLERIADRTRSYFEHVHAELERMRSRLHAPWQKDRKHTAFYQAGWLLPARLQAAASTGLSDLRSPGGATHELAGDTPRRAAPAKDTQAESGFPLIGLSQSQHAEGQRTGIGSGFQGYHRRSTRRCRIEAPLRNTAHVAQATLTVHHRAALLGRPAAETLAQLLEAYSSLE